MDQIFTPPELGRALLALANLSKVRRVADFAAGDGALLSLAAKEWPKAEFIGCDIDPNPLRTARKRISNGTFTRCDFLDDHARRQNRPLKRVVGQVSLILLNPPFSGRGHRTYGSALEGEETRSGKAIAFVIRALEYLAVGGTLLAILPSSCFSSERDEQAMQLIRRWYKVERVGPTRHQQFYGHTVGIDLVRFSHRAYPRLAIAAAATRSSQSVYPFDVVVARGSRYAATMKPARNGIPFVHTTHLSDNRVTKELPKTKPRTDERLYSRGVLVPRVGRPDARKVCRLPSRRKVIPSDCLFVLQTKPAGHESELQEALLENWSKVRRSYAGSCAPYLTMRKLIALLSGLDFDVEVASKFYKPDS